MKRFTETEKWKDKWFCSLKPLHKLTWEYLRDNCDNAGFFELNPKLDSYLIGITEEEYLGAIKGLMRGLIESKEDGKFWIKKFLFHQKNIPLNPANNAHKQIIGIIRENVEKFEYSFDYLGAYEGLISPPGKGNSKGIIEVDKGGMGELLPWDAKKIKHFFDNSSYWAETVCMNKKITPAQLKIFQSEFLKDVTDSTQTYPNQQEAIKHFNNHLKKQLNGNNRSIPGVAEKIPTGRTAGKF